MNRQWNHQIQLSQQSFVHSLILKRNQSFSCSFFLLKIILLKILFKNTFFFYFVQLKMSFEGIDWK